MIINWVNLIMAFALGIAIGIFLLFIKKKNDEKQLIDLKSKSLSDMGLINELRSQIEQKDKTIENIRISLETEQKEKTIAATKLEEASKNIEEQKKILEQSQEKLTTEFKALSGESLKSNNKAFLELAKESLGIVLSDAKGDLSKKEEAVKNLVKPLEDALKRYENQVSELEKTRAQAYGNLETQIKNMISSEQLLQKETGNLVTALRKPEVRGRWGEVTLKRVVELAGMSEHCDYIEQVSIDTDEGRLRPDMIIHLPADREIVIDSKTSLNAYLDSISADSEEKRNDLLKKHFQQIRKHMKALSDKSYWDQFPRAPEFTVMFIPGESFLSAALDHDPLLIEDGMASRVIIATPTTLIALLRAIAYGWRQEQIAKNAQEIATLGKEIYDRFQPFIEHINKTGNSLNQAVVSFNKMIMSLERRVLVSVRKFKELGATGDKELPEIQPIEQIPMKSQDNEEKDEDTK